MSSFFMRVGDFYEAYGDDAELLSLQLEITLTGREDKQFGGRIPMAGVPYHAVERFAARPIVPAATAIGPSANRSKIPNRPRDW